MTDFNRLGRIANHRGNDFVVKSRQNRLNHLPFTVKVDIVSEKATRGIVRMYWDLNLMNLVNFIVGMKTERILFYLMLSQLI